MKYQSVIGLEVHVQLKTQSKLFCSCSTLFGQEPNTQTCPVCTGMPGVLPVLNRKVVEYSIKTGLALHCTIAPRSIFARKNYFYPDLPKNYQISQYELPLALNGYLEFEREGERKRIGILRIHMEEDAGKLLHFIGSRPIDGSLVDLNRTGVPLMEIVTLPEIYSAEDAYLYLINLKSILKYLDVSDCNMEEGSLRCDANVSVRPIDQQDRLGIKTEVKNLNSFKAVQKALDYEIERHMECLDRGGRIIQETRLWDEKKEMTFSMRSKEEAHDYRYFPEPDLVPVEVNSEWIESIRKELPELPQARRGRILREFGLSPYMTDILVSEQELIEYFETCMHISKTKNKDIAPTTVGNWIIGDLLRNLNQKSIGIASSPVTPEGLLEVLVLIEEGIISGKIAKTVFDEMFATGKGAHHIVKEKGLVQINDKEALSAIVEDVLSQNAQSVEDFKAGKEKALKHLVGQVMRQTKGRANPQVVNTLLTEKLK